MRCKKYFIWKVIIKAAMALVSGLLISTVLLCDTGTFSYFTSASSGSINASAASSSHVVKSVEVEGINPGSIKLTGADNLKTDSMVYFSMEGDGTDYGLHINPVRLRAGIQSTAPLRVNVTLDKLLMLLSQGTNVTCTVRAKYLNGFVDQARDISFTREFLIEEFFRRIGRPRVINPGDINDATTNFYIADIMEYTAGYGTWENVPASGIWTASGGQDFSFPELRLTEDQESVIKIIAPGMKEYVQGLYQSSENLWGQLEIKNQQIDDKNKQIEELKAGIEALEQQKTTDPHEGPTPTPGPSVTPAPTLTPSPDVLG